MDQPHPFLDRIAPVEIQQQEMGSQIEDEVEDETAGYMEQEEIIIKKGKKLKQVK